MILVLGPTCPGELESWEVVAAAGGSAQVLLEGWALWGLGVSLGPSSVIKE